MLTFVHIAHAATETYQAAPEAGGISALGLDAKALLFQLVNFALLLGLLRAFAYKPILNVLRSRQQTIAKSLTQAQEIEQGKAELAVHKQQVVAEARGHAQEIVTQSKYRAAEIVQAAEIEARHRAEQIVEQARARLEQEAAAIRAGLKHEALRLVADATQAIVDVKLDKKQDEKLIQDAIKQASKQ